MECSHIGCTTLAITVLFLSACSGSGSGSNGIVNDSPEGDRFISGRVIDAITGIPIQNTMVTTAPPTEVRLTDRDGTYLLRDSVFTGSVFDVTARHLGYDADTRTVTVSADSASGADFTLESAVHGLVASVNTLQIPTEEPRATFLLSSTLDDTPFSIQTTNEAFSATPSAGTLAQNELLVIEVRLSTGSGQPGRVSGQLVANASNGGTGVTINLLGNVPIGEINADEDDFGPLVNDEGELVTGISGDEDGHVSGIPVVHNPPAPSDACGEFSPTAPEVRGITFGESVTGDLETLTSTDVYGFDACSGDELYVMFAQAVGSSGFFTLMVELRDSAGGFVKANQGDRGTLVTPIETGGRYTLWITNPDRRATGSYEFTLQRTNNPAANKSIAYGATVLDSISGPADLDVFVFQANGGDNAIVEFSQAANSNGFFTLGVELRDSTGVSLGSELGDQGRLSVTAMRSGNHFLWVYNPDLNVPGDYEFTLRRAN